MAKRAHLGKAGSDAPENPVENKTQRELLHRAALLGMARAAAVSR